MRPHLSSPRWKIENHVSQSMVSILSRRLLAEHAERGAVVYFISSLVDDQRLNVCNRRISGQIGTEEK